METRTNLYPVYVSGQYLTSEHLNETQDFLWEEEKATRYLLIGNGIADGMVADFVGTSILQSITISKGVGSTVDGYIVDVVKDTDFGIVIDAHLVLYTLADGSQDILDKADFDTQQEKLNPTSSKEFTGYELIATDTDPAKLPDGNKKVEALSVTISSGMNDYVVVAYVQITDLANNHCQQGDCNTKGIQRNFSIRYFLLKNDFLNTQNFASSEYPLCSVARIKNLSGVTTTASLNQKSYDAWTISFKELNAYFTLGSGIEFKTVAANCLDQNSINALANSTTKFSQINASVSGSNCPQYYVAFASDLSIAINELICYYNLYARKYPKYTADRICQTIIIGMLRSSGLDKFRSYFLSDNYLNNVAYDGKMLQLLFNRVLALIDNFILASNFNTKIAIIPNRPRQTPTLNGTDAMLQNCAIPRYLDITASGSDNTLIKYWNPDGGNLRNVFCYYDPVARPEMSSKTPATSWARFNFFLLEGHIGMSKTTALANIKNLIADQGLPIQVIDCAYSLPSKGTSSADMKAIYETQLKAWGTLIVKRKAEFPLITSKFTELLTALSNTGSTRLAFNLEIGRTLGKTSTSKTLDGVFGDINAYLGTIFSTRTKSTPATAAFDAERAKFVALTSVKADYAKLQASYGEYKTGIVVNPTSTQLLLKDFSDLEYLAGVARGGTFVLIHDGATVQGDGCLPYYFNINKARVI